MTMLQNANAISAGGYDINNSLRFRSSASAYLNRTPASAGNRQIMTYSFWVKRGAITGDYNITNATTDASNSATFYFNSSNSQSFDVFLKVGGTNYSVTTSQVFRDPSAWYHIIVAIDTTQATASNRTKVYVNGSQVTNLLSASYVPQNSNLALNNNVAQYIGFTNYLDGYLAEFNFIDGQALTPSSFGETDTTTGSWKPKAYTGTYGTNGFYLKFSDIATTSGSNAGLGKDFSGNTNYWTTNNISVTAGVTYDAMIDSPTNTSATVANYATLNPVLQNGWWAAPNRGTISNGNLTHSSGGNTTAFGNFDFVSNSGKWYYEVNCGATDSNNTVVIAALSRSTFEVGYYQSGLKQINGATPTSYGSSWTSGDVIGVAIDVPNNTITFYKNNVSQGAITNTFPTGQPVYGGSYYNSTSGDYNYNFGQRPFTYTPPTGYVALNTYNLPDSTIKKGSSYMDATLYTGTGTTNVIVNQGQFKPDLIWLKQRSVVGNHGLYDSIRGISNRLISNLTNAEASVPLDSFNTNGFTTTSNYNNLGETIVGWQWQAGQGSTSSNTSGSITSTVSVSTTAGFSVVTYTGTGANATVGHGLGVAPKFIILKSRSGVLNWVVYHDSLANTQYIVLNTTAAAATASTIFNNTRPTSTVFSLGSGSTSNTNGGSYVAYCWADVSGFSKAFSYTGNASTDGPFVYTGFRPKFVMAKRSDSTGDWAILDASRNTYNVSNAVLYANLSNAEDTANLNLDILSNGFKLRSTIGNGSGGTYIYMAFAESPFKSSLAR